MLYKRQKQCYLFIICGTIFYLVILEAGAIHNSIMLSIFLIIILLATTKIYSNNINNEHNNKKLESMKADYKKFSIKSKPY
jgi:hypothetical protein